MEERVRWRETERTEQKEKRNGRDSNSRTKNNRNKDGRLNPLHHGGRVEKIRVFELICLTGGIVVV